MKPVKPVYKYGVNCGLPSYKYHSQKLNSSPADNSLTELLKLSPRCCLLSSPLASSELSSAYRNDTLKACRLLRFHFPMAPMAKSFGEM